MTTETIKCAVNEAVREAIKTEGLPEGREFANAKYCQKRFGVGLTRLKRLADEGVIRRKRTGDSVQAGALYHVGDLSSWMYSARDQEGE